jgi:DNA-binding CsgD family transcriptional regulator
MILEGANATETAQVLKIAETTVQGYYKRLLSKTRSRNRPAMVANVLDWAGSGRSQATLE